MIVFFLSKTIGNRLGLNKTDKICLSVPLYHCFGMVLGNLASLNAAAAVVLPSESFSAKLSMEATSKYKCTTMYGVPTMFYEYIREYELNPTAYDRSSLKKGIMAGALCPESLMTKLINEWGMTDL